MLSKEDIHEYREGRGKAPHNLSRLTPNDTYMGRTAPLASKRCILYIYSTNIGAEYFKHALYSPFFSLQNAVCFIMLTCLVAVLFTFYIQYVLKLKKTTASNVPIVAIDVTTSLSLTGNRDWVLCIEYEVFI